MSSDVFNRNETRFVIQKFAKRFVYLFIFLFFMIIGLTHHVSKLYKKSQAASHPVYFNSGK